MFQRKVPTKRHQHQNNYAQLNVVIAVFLDRNPNDSCCRNMESKSYYFQLAQHENDNFVQEDPLEILHVSFQ